MQKFSTFLENLEDTLAHLANAQSGTAAASIRGKQTSELDPDDSDSEHVLDSDPELRRLAKRLNSIGQNALKNRHVIRMMQILKKNPGMDANTAVVMAMHEMFTQKQLLWKRPQQSS